jgi:hypothetical protein
MRKSLLFAAALTAIVSGATSGSSTKKALEPVRAIGAPIDCVNTYSIRDTKIVDDRTIDFKMSGNKTYRNVLPFSCSGLRFEERFSYHPTNSRLCSVDIIRVLNNYAGQLQEGAGCGLGKFQQIEKIAAQ